jgi:hypothetical protein
MPRAESTDIPLDGYGSAESRVDHLANSWAEPFADNDVEQAPATAGDEHFFQPVPQGRLNKILTTFGSQRKLLVSTALVAALAVGALTYIFRPAAGEKKQTEAPAVSPAVQSAPGARVQATPQNPEPSFAERTAIAWPDAPSSVPVEASPQITTAAPAGNSVTRIPASQNQEIAFVQRPGVHIRSAPSTTGTVVGTPPKGTRFKVTKRDRDWVQLESDRFKGWINSQFVGPNAPR